MPSHPAGRVKVVVNGTGADEAAVAAMLAVMSQIQWACVVESLGDSSNVVGHPPTYRCVELKIMGPGSPRVGAKRT
jgi:hypothetical protein